MRYVLNPKVGLRSWERIPFAYQMRGERLPHILSAEMFGVLSRCDGEHDLPEAGTGERGDEDGAGTAGAMENGSPASPASASAPAPAPAGASVPAPAASRTSAVPALLAQALREGLIQPAAPGQTWNPWSAPRSYDNRLFHSMIWAITGRCNLNCRHCFMARDNAPMMGEFSWEECLALLDECERCGVQSFTLTGGEPLLHPRFMELVAEMSRRDMDLVELNTNGVLLTPELLQELRAQGQSPEVKVSFDGVGHHDWLRGGTGCEQQALDAMRLAKDMGFRVWSQTNVHRGNLAAMRDTVRLLDSMGVDLVRIIRTTESPRWLENSPDATLGVVEYYDAMLELARQILEDKLSIAVDMWQFAAMRPGADIYSYHPAQIGCRAYRDTIPVCHDARGNISVSYTGEVLPCNQLSGLCASRGISFGNVHKTPLHELLRSGTYCEHISMPVSEVRDHPGNEECARCEHWPVCVGGCRAVALLVSGDYRALDPTKCAFFKGGYMAKLDELFAATGRPWRCLSDVGAMGHTGDEAGYRRALELLGPHA